MTGWKPRIRVHANGRISFPGVVSYDIGGDESERRISLPYPPTCRSHPAEPEPVALSGPTVAREVAEGRIKPIPTSAPYRIVVHDLAEYERLAATRWIYDARHIGDQAATPIDNFGAAAGAA